MQHSDVGTIGEKGWCGRGGATRKEDDYLGKNKTDTSASTNGHAGLHCKAPEMVCDGEDSDDSAHDNNEATCALGLGGWDVRVV
jgi:hypothetical protein